MDEPAAGTQEQSTLEALAERLGGVGADALTLGLIYLGDRLDLFAALRASGPATSHELAARTGLVERYLREWLAGMAAAGLLAYDPATTRFTLTPEQAACFADPDSGYYSTPVAQLVLKVLEQADALADAFRRGGGVAYSAYDPGLMEGIERATSAGFRLSLVQKWLPAIPGLVETLRAGGSMLDVGCGGGHACIEVARAFPRAQVMGIDPHEPAIARARANAAAAGLGDRVRFEALAAEQLPPGTAYDLVATFDVIHDLVDPLGVLRAIRVLLGPESVYLMVEENVADRVEDNLNPGGQFYYGFSTFHCLPISLAHGGAGIGLVMGEAMARELVAAAGFTRFTRLPIDEVACYAVRP